MSTPKNILGKFDTYAYHHILMVCNSTTTAEALAATDEITSFQHPYKAPRYSARSIGEIDGGKYVTLIDGTTDARFYITDVRWSNVLAAEPEVGKGDIAQSTTMSTDGEMEIVEPMGAAFLNRLTEICDTLDTDPVGLVFVLKTIFVGRNANGNTEMISTVRPMMFIAFDITAVFDSSGAKYKLEFVGLTNGAGKLPQPQKIFEGLSMQYQANLADTIQELETLVNNKYEGFKAKATSDFATTLEGLNAIEASIEAANFLQDNYRDVRYKINLDEIYKQDKAKYLAGDVEHSRIKEKNTGATVNFGPDVSVENVLNLIMKSCGGVLDDSKGVIGESADGGKVKKRYMFKIISTLRSSPEEYVIEYHIKRYLMADSPYVQQEKDGKIVPLPGQSIEFDYIFTGKNVDIKNFDIKMEMGMAFFQIAATTNNIPAQKEAVLGPRQKSVKVGGSSYVASSGKKRRGKSPLFLGTTLKQTPMRNTTRPIDSASFSALLDRHASLENVSASMVIYGNPQLLDEMSILPSEVSSGQTENPVEDATINPRWLSSPTLIKVNIKMPIDANDVNTEYEQFWYSGYYNLLTVDNIFSDGTFTQELGMFSIPISDQLQEVADDDSEDIVPKTINSSFPQVAEDGVTVTDPAALPTNFDISVQREGLFSDFETGADKNDRTRNNSLDVTHRITAEEPD